MRVVCVRDGLATTNTTGAGFATEVRSRVSGCCPVLVCSELEKPINRNLAMLAHATTFFRIESEARER